MTGVNYPRGAFIVPPKAEVKVPPSALHLYERKRWYLQFKKNGASTEIIVPPRGSGEPVRALSGSTGAPHKAWRFSEASRAAFERARGTGWTVFYAELLHSKVSGLRDTHYVYDVLAHDDRWLLGTSYATRHSILLRAMPPIAGTSATGYWRVDENTWIARNFRDDFRGRFDALVHDEDEGVVLKDPNGVLSSAGCGWAVKCRRPHKNFGF